MSALFVSVVISTFKREEYLRRALESLLIQTYPSYEILVVNQGDWLDSSILSYLEAHNQKIKLYSLDVPSLPQARNSGIAHAKGEIILFCDDDIIADKDLIRFHAEQYADPGIAAVAGRIITEGFEKKPFILLKKRISPWGEVALSGRFLFNAESQQRGVVSSGRGVNLSFRKKALDMIGGFDTSFIGSYSYEDVDACYRIRKSGFKIIYEPRACLIHQAASAGGCAIESIPERERAHFHNAALFYLKNMNRLFLPYMVFVFFLIAIKKALLPTMSMRAFLFVLGGLKAGASTYVKKKNIIS